MLSEEIQAEILMLHFGSKRSIRSIAREFGITRKAVRGVIERRAVLAEPRKSTRTSLLDPYKPYIAELMKLDPKIPGTAIFQRLRDKGYPGGITILQDYVGKQRSVLYRPREAFLRIVFSAGESAQVDWGEFGNVFGDGVKIHCFAMILCYSRLLYIEFTRSEKFEDFIRCHENAFRYFGGLVPRECWYDNLTSAVTDRMGSLVRFNARFMAYLGHHGVRPHACNPARGNEKGRVEDVIKYIRSSFWPGKNFSDFDDLCRQATHWMEHVANKREHRSTRKIPILHFKADEKEKMQPMNNNTYDTDEIFSRVIPPDFHIVYETNRYSVPWTLVGISVTVRVNHQELKIFYNDRFITKHIRSYKKHTIFTKPEHQKGLLERKPGANRQGWQIEVVKSIGPAMIKYLDLIRSGQRSIRSEVGKIIALATVYGHNEVNAACNELIQSSILGVHNLELLLKSRCKSENQLPKPLSFQKQRLNRVIPSVDLRRYDELLFESIGDSKNILEGDDDE